MTPKPPGPEREAAGPPDVEDALAALSDTTPVDVAECRAACEALEAATLRSCRCHRRVLDADGARSLVLAMQRHPADAELQIAAAGALQHLAASEERDTCSQLVAAGACEAICTALTAHPQHSPLQQVACNALEILALGSSEAGVAVAAEGGADAAVQVLKAPSAGLEARRAAAMMLQAMLGVGDEVVDRIVSQGGVPAAVSALCDQKDDPLMQYWGQMLLRGLCAGKAEVKAEVQRKCHWQGVELDLA
ncbi:unnamed protein product [Prorocentrum cordatum]|nr:unnamed protein product [Polarella glacialis]